MFAMTMSGGKQAARMRSIFPPDPRRESPSRLEFCMPRALIPYPLLRLSLYVHFFSRSVHSLLVHRDASAR